MRIKAEAAAEVAAASTRAAAAASTAAGNAAAEGSPADAAGQKAQLERTVAELTAALAAHQKDFDARLRCVSHSVSCFGHTEFSCWVPGKLFGSAKFPGRPFVLDHNDTQTLGEGPLACRMRQADGATQQETVLCCAQHCSGAVL